MHYHIINYVLKSMGKGIILSKNIYMPWDGVKSNQSHMFLDCFWITAVDICDELSEEN